MSKMYVEFGEALLNISSVLLQFALDPAIMPQLLEWLQVHQDMDLPEEYVPEDLRTLLAAVERRLT